ncbi:MAG: hypothetical protein E6I80_29030 [Chloroflexi bacterium]|nr:MAG: hypothetical protein E6I80_29030 [Chloroflexota bacterium]
MPKQAYKFRLYPTKKQAQSLTWTLDRCRELYNAGATSTYLLTLSEATNKGVCW